MNDKKSFVLYTDLADSIDPLSDEQAGRLFRAILRFADDGTTAHDLDSATRMAFSFVSSQIARDSEKWERIKEKRAAAGRVGGLHTQANQANASFAKQIKQKQANQAVNVPVTVPVPVPVNVPVPVIDNTLTGVKGVGKPPQARFEKPTVQEISDYCISRGNDIDAQSFFDFYEARGWMVGKNHMKDWKAAVRTWENRQKERAGKHPESIDDQFKRVLGGKLHGGT